MLGSAQGSARSPLGQVDLAMLPNMTNNLGLLAAVLLTAMTIGLGLFIFAPSAQRSDFQFPRYAIYLALHAALSVSAWIAWFFG
jgi:hypothetical protein